MPSIRMVDGKNKTHPRKGLQQERKPRDQGPTEFEKIGDMGIKHVDLMKDSIFHGLSSVTKDKESSGALITTLCKHYDEKRKGFQLNEKVFLRFCAKEVADIIGMEDSGTNFKEFETNKYPSIFPPFVKNIKGSTITIKELKEKLSAMDVENDDAAQNFRRLMTFYLIEGVIRLNRNNTAQGSQWWIVLNLDACESVNWAKYIEHVAMEEDKTLWFEKGGTGQQLFVGAAPVLEAILFERIVALRPTSWDDVSPKIQKWKSYKKPEAWFIDIFDKLNFGDCNG